jgi:hypothetical protein
VAKNSMAGDGINAATVTVEILRRQRPRLAGLIVEPLRWLDTAQPTLPIALRLKFAALAAKSLRNLLRPNSTLKPGASARRVRTREAAAL